MAQVNKQTVLLIWRQAGLGRVLPQKRRKIKSRAGWRLLHHSWLNAHGTLQPDRCEIRGENFHWQGDAWSLVLVTVVRPVAVNNCARSIN